MANYDRWGNRMSPEQEQLLEEAKLNKQLNFSINIDSKTPSIVAGDSVRLSQIFFNFISNAIKFTPKNGNINLNIKPISINDKLANIEFSINDTGIGIPEEKLNSVFEPFVQTSNDTARKYGGTGLGLTIVKKLVELLGGTIKLHSELGKGSTFYFDLDIEISNKKVELDKEIELEIPLDFSDDILEGKNVLIVEDNKINQMITKKMLEKKGMECTVLENGEDAIENLKKNQYDLVLMDVHLPGINGTEATAIIRKFDSKTPIIALTAISLNENREMLLSFGMNDVITKPFIPEDFYNVISNHLTVSQ